MKGNDGFSFNDVVRHVNVTMKLLNRQFENLDSQVMLKRLTKCIRLVKLKLTVSDVIKNEREVKELRTLLKKMEKAQIILRKKQIRGDLSDSKRC